MAGARSQAVCEADVTRRMRANPMAFAAGMEPRRRGHAVLGYPSKQAAIRALSDAGVAVSDIAEQVGVSANFVRAIQWRFNPLKSKNAQRIIDMRRRGHTPHAIAAELGLSLDYVLSVIRMASHLIGRKVNRIELPRTAQQVLQREAERRGTSTEALAVRILCTIAEDELFDAVLDVDEGESA